MLERSHPTDLEPISQTRQTWKIQHELGAPPLSNLEALSRGRPRPERIGSDGMYQGRHTGGHSLSSGKSMLRSKSRCRRDLVSSLLAQKHMESNVSIRPVSRIRSGDRAGQALTNLTLSGSEKSSWRFDLSLGLDEGSS